MCTLHILTAHLQVDTNNVQYVPLHNEQLLYPLSEIKRVIF